MQKLQLSIRKFLILSSLTLLFVVPCNKGYAQSKIQRGWINFKDSIHDFGLVKELGGSVIHEFSFVNSGKSNLTIEKVRASCGCTTPGWTETVVAPGDTGFVQAKFDPNNRPGSFEKMLYVTSNAENHDIILKIRGNVEPRPRTPADDYPMKIGETRFKSRVINMGKVLSNQKVSRTVKVYNTSEQPIIFMENTISPEFISLKVTPDTLLPAETAHLTVEYDAVLRNDLGYSNDQVVIFTSEDSASQKMLSVVATVEEYFPPLTAAQLESAPRMRIEPENYDFGSLSEGEKLKIDVELVNEGKQELEIRKIIPNCNCTGIKIESMTIPVGESGILKVLFSAEDLKGYQYKTITLFTNDPSKPTQVITLKGKVLQN